MTVTASVSRAHHGPGTRTPVCTKRDPMSSSDPAVGHMSIDVGAPRFLEDPYAGKSSRICKSWRAWLFGSVGVVLIILNSYLLVWTMKSECVVSDLIKSCAFVRRTVASTRCQNMPSARPFASARPLASAASLALRGQGNAVKRLLQQMLIQLLSCFHCSLCLRMASFFSTSTKLCHLIVLAACFQHDAARV